MDLIQIGKELRNYRLSKDIPLRTFCKKYNLDALTVSKIERGCEESQEVKYTLEAIEMIRKSGEKNGKIECPKCKGILSFTISSYNGHIWGKCEMGGCLSWMQ
jgi:phage FluMu protein Com